MRWTCQCVGPMQADIPSSVPTKPFIKQLLLLVYKRLFNALWFDFTSQLGLRKTTFLRFFSVNSHYTNWICLDHVVLKNWTKPYYKYNFQYSWLPIKHSLILDTENLWNFENKDPLCKSCSVGSSLSLRKSRTPNNFCELNLSLPGFPFKVGT